MTNRYLNGIPADSRAASGSQFLNPDQITEEKLEKVRKLNAMAEERGQSCPRWRWPGYYAMRRDVSADWGK